MVDVLPNAERLAMQNMLQGVFDDHTSGVMLTILGQVITVARNGSATREDFGELKRITESLARTQEYLAQAQTRSEKRMGRVEAAIERLDATVEKLAEAQARSEKRLDRVEAAIERLDATVEKLAEAQACTERALGRLQKQVGGLSDSIGGDIEDIAYIVLHEVLQREFGWKVGVLERTWQIWNGQPEEVNIFGQATDPAQQDKTVWIVGEAKHNLTIKEVDRYLRQLKRARKHLTGEIFPVCFCYRARPEVQEKVSQKGVHLVFSYKKLVKPTGKE